MTPGIRIYAQAGTYLWPSYHPIAPTNQPATAADIIAHQLRTTTQHPTRHDRHPMDLTPASSPSHRPAPPPAPGTPGRCGPARTQHSTPLE